MDDLIKALQIFSKYIKTDYPTNCSHDILCIRKLDSEPSEEDKIELDKLGFHYNNEYGWYSYRFGSC